MACQGIKVKNTIYFSLKVPLLEKLFYRSAIENFNKHEIDTFRNTMLKN